MGVIRSAIGGQKILLTYAIEGGSRLIENVIQCLQTARRRCRADLLLQLYVREPYSKRTGVIVLRLRQTCEGGSLAGDQLQILCDSLSFRIELKALDGYQRQLRIQRLIELSHELVEIVHAKQGGYQLGLLPGRFSRNSGE
ncbi:hypothetical protein D3C80_1403350 [compost metagenome]